MEPKPPGVLSLVLWPALLTLAVTILRLVGELQGWPVWLAGTAAGGDNAVLGISWLIFVFGLWFGLKLQRAGKGPRRPGIALVVAIVGIAVVFGGMAALQAMDLVWFPDEQHPGEPRGTLWFFVAMAAGCAVVAVAWPRAALVTLVYAVLARLPVVVVTWIALGQPDWHTHYTQVPQFFLGIEESERAAFLLLPQITFWPAITVLFGAAMACLGAVLFPRRKA